MAQPVKIADSLLEAARAAAEDAHRSMAAQIEHWAVLGRAVEQALTTGDVVALKRSEGRLDEAQRAALMNALARAFDPNQATVTRAAIALRDPMRYETDPSLPGLLIQRLPDGQRRIGRTRRNAAQALSFVDIAAVIDNSCLDTPFRLLEWWERGRCLHGRGPQPT